MKKLLILIFAANSVSAQFFEDNFIYTSPTVYLGPAYRAASLNLEYTYKDKLTVELTRLVSLREARTKPNDYQSPGIFGSRPILYPIVPDGPHEEVRGIELLVGRVFVPKNQNLIRFKIMGGPAYTRLTNLVNWRTERFPGFLGGGYDGHVSDRHEYETLSAVFKAKMELLFSRYFGVSIVSHLSINKDRTDFAPIGFSLMTGILRGRKKPVVNKNLWQ